MATGKWENHFRLNVSEPREVVVMGLRIVVSMICFEVLSERPSSSSMLQSMVITLFGKVLLFQFFSVLSFSK